MDTKTLRDSNEQLTSELGMVKRERNALRAQVEAVQSSGNGGVVDPSVLFRMRELEQQLSERNNEMRVLYRDQGEHLKKLIDCEADVKAAQGALAESQTHLGAVSRERDGLRGEVATLRQTIADMGTAKAIMDQELQAMQMAYLGLEEAHTRLQRDHEALIERMLLKAQEDANRMNEANTFYESMLAKKAQERLVEAATATVAGRVDASRTSLLDAMGSASGLSDVPRLMITSTRAHEREGFALDYSMTGDAIATGGGENAVHVFGARPTFTDRPRRIAGFSGAITSVHHSPNGELLLASSVDKSIRLFFARTDRSHHALTGHSSKIQRAVFMPSSAMVVSGSADRTIKLWDVDRGSCLKTVTVPKSVQDLCVTADGSVIVSSHVNGRIMLFDTRSTDCVGSIDLTEAGHIVTSVNVYGDSILASVRDSSLRLIDWRMQAVAHEMRHERFALGTNSARATFSPDGSFVACGGLDGSLYVWDTSGAFHSAVSGIAKEAITAVCWRPNGRSVAAVTKRGDLLVFE